MYNIFIYWQGRCVYDALFNSHLGFACNLLEVPSTDEVIFHVKEVLSNTKKKQLESFTR